MSSPWSIQKTNDVVSLSPASITNKRLNTSYQDDKLLETQIPLWDCKVTKQLKIQEAHNVLEFKLWKVKNNFHLVLYHLVLF